MATTQVANSDSLNVLRVQEKLIAYMAERDNPYSGMIGESIESAIQRITDLEKQRGDTVKVHLGTKLSDQGVTDDDTLEGNEEAMNYHNDLAAWAA